MTFTDDAWAATADIRAGIDALPFLAGLRDGSLEEATFRFYMTQDALYLARYGRALAAAASQSPTADELVFWSERARDCIVVERELHASRLTDPDGAAMSPTCTAYTSYLLSLAADGSYPVLVAGVLPCFWIYDDVGSRLKAEVTANVPLADHPYGDWIDTYGDPDFAEQTRQAKAVVDAAAERSGADVRARMLEAYTIASRYEWMFWESAQRHETWPIG